MKDDINAYKRLWLSVIIQAIEDLVSIPNKEDLESILSKSQAKVWFRTNCADFKEVCLNADVNSEWLRSKVLEADIDELREVLHEYRRIM